MVDRIILILLVIIFLIIKSRYGYSSFKEGLLTYKDCPPDSQKNMFRTWKKSLNQLPNDVLIPMKDAMKMNPDYSMYYFSDEDVIQFIGDNFPDDLPAYNSLVPGAFKADVFRLMVLYRYGGVYNDIGHTFIAPIEEIKGPCDHVLVKDDDSLDFWIYNAFIIAPSGSEVIKKMLDRALENIRNKTYGDDQMDITGPINCGKALNLYWNKPEKSNIDTGDNNNIRILTHPKHGDIHLLSKTVVKTKFANYYGIVYADGGYYSDLYSSRKVYK